MGTLAIIVFIIVLIALGIVIYFDFMPEGREQDVKGSLEEAKLQGRLLETVKETREVQQELHEKFEELK